MFKTLFGRCIYKTDEIKIMQNLYYRWFTYKNDNYLQTVLNRLHHEIPCLNYLKPLTLPMLLKPADTLLLGLGGGAIVHILKNSIKNDLIVGVENNNEIIQIAKKYFYLEEIENLQIIYADAQQYVKNCYKDYQYIIIDLFKGSSFPEDCNTIEFFEDCLNILKPHGILAVNTATLYDNWDIYNKIKKVFEGNTLVFPIQNSVNNVIIAIKPAATEQDQFEYMSELLDLIKSKITIKDLSWNPEWGRVVKI